MSDMSRNMEGREAKEILDSILADYELDRTIDKMEDFYDQPNKEVIIDIIEKLMKIIYPGYYRDRAYKSYHANHHLSTLIEDVLYRLSRQIAKVSKFCPKLDGKCREQIEKESYEITVDFLRQIPKIREYLEGDLQAALEGDPAANSYGEIILAYPGLFAITINRLAHELFIRSVPLIPRIMTEYAHSITGIDIHPGATIGKGFFIDHGSGVIIGETAIVGDNVTLYQGVTLGGTGKETGKRHPTIGDNVMISAGAKIIGSFTVGENSKIGAGSVVLEEVPPNCTVVGVPGRVVKRDNIKIPRSDMDQCHLPDPVKEDITLLQRENAELVNRVLDLERQLKEVDRKVRQD